MSSIIQNPSGTRVVLVSGDDFYFTDEPDRVNFWLRKQAGPLHVGGGHYINANHVTSFGPAPIPTTITPFSLDGERS